jgi:hypothetical protein
MAFKACWAAVSVAVILCVGPSLVGSSALCAGQPSAQAAAEAHIQRGLELRRKGRDAEGLAEFEEAMKRSPSARAKAQVGLAQMAIGLFEAAEVSLSEVLAASPDEPWVSAHRAALNDALVKIRSHLGVFNASGEPQGATVEVNGTAVGALPCSVHVQAGDVVVKVLAPGFIPITRTVAVEARKTSNQVFTLVRVPSDPTPARVSSDKAPDRASSDKAPEKAAGDKGAHAEPGAEGSHANPSGGSPPPSHTSPWPWITAGGSLLALSFGAVETVRWTAKASDFNNMKDPAGNPICNTGGAAAGGGSCATLLSEGHTARALAIGGVAVGAALGITSVVLFLRDSPGDPHQALSCTPTVGTPGVLCAARF